MLAPGPGKGDYRSPSASSDGAQRPTLRASCQAKCPSGRKCAASGIPWYRGCTYCLRLTPQPGVGLWSCVPFMSGRSLGGSQSGGLWLWLVAGKPCSANGFVSAGGQRNDVSTAALAKERDRLFLRLGRDFWPSQ
jgi:hypothetical protein